MLLVFQPFSFGYEIKAFCCSSYFDWPYLIQHKKENYIFKPRVQPSFFITLITWQNTARVHKNVDVQFSANNTFLE